ncbi:MAG TPA: TRAP transporter fused permease subunit [Thermodesulfobacteriota bacterium]
MLAVQTEKTSDAPAEVPEVPGESQPRPLAGYAYGISAALVLALVGFQLYTATFGVLPVLVQRSVHVGLALAIVFATFPAGRRSPRSRVPAYDWLLVAAAFVTAGYVTVNYDEIIRSVGRPSTELERWLSVGLTLAVLEAGRRTVGWILPAMALAAIAYALFGDRLPGVWTNRGFGFDVVQEVLYLSAQGFWGEITGISATTIAVFLLFGAVLQYTGGGDSFVAIARCVAGRAPGGPAKVSVVSSSLFGTISGSAVANVVVDGIFNIPLMKRTGYRPEFAAAVEATASTGGQLVPPIMGAAAFVMAQMINVSYWTIAASAVLPALLYYLAIWVGIHLEALKGGLPGVPPQLVPAWREVITVGRLAPLVIPVGLLLLMMGQGFTPETAAYVALWGSIVVFLGPWGPTAYRDRFRTLFTALLSGGKAIALVAVLIATAEIIVAMVGLTGVGVKFSELLVAAGGGNRLAALVFSMLLTLVLGMGLPTTAAYVLAAAVVAPTLVRLGLEPLPAHMFVFYFAIIGAITPPVCAAVWVAASIARCNWWRTGWEAVRLGLAGFVVPYFFAYDPALLLSGDVWHVALAAVTAVTGVVALQMGNRGYVFQPIAGWLRGVLVALGLLLIWPHAWASLAALVVFAALLAVLRLRRRSRVVDAT